MNGAIRTRQEEDVIQNFTLEQQAWYLVERRHKAEEQYARDKAREFLSKLKVREERDGDWLPALKFVSDRTAVRKWVVLNEVTEDHVEYCCDLIQAVARTRYKELLRIFKARIGEV